MDRVARRGSLARAPGALKSHNAEKLKRGDPLRFFNIHSVAKHEKIEKKVFNFGKKPHNAGKTERGDPLGFFSIHSVAKHEKIEENKSFNFREKISQCRKN